VSSVGRKSESRVSFGPLFELDAECLGLSILLDHVIVVPLILHEEGACLIEYDLLEVLQEAEDRCLIPAPLAQPKLVQSSILWAVRAHMSCRYADPSVKIVPPPFGLFMP
jgi:hypothetical protein